MFATIHTISEPENFWGKIKYNLLPPPVKAEKIETEEGSGFLKLTVPVVRGKIYWNNVRAAAGGALPELLSPSGVRLHEQVDLRLFKSERFNAMVCINSFLHLLSLLPRTALLPECAVIDFGATLSHALKSLPRYCRTVKVITGRPEHYADFCNLCMEEYGTAVFLSEQIGKAFDSPVVLFPKRAEIPTAFSRGSLVFAGQGENLYTSNLLIPEGVSLPTRYLRLLPPGISPASFAAALYEASGVHSLGKSRSPAFRMQNRILSYAEVISLLD